MVSTINLSRIINSILLIIGLLFFKPLAYFIAVMMFIAGLTNYCLMEKILQRFGVRHTCTSNFVNNSVYDNNYLYDKTAYNKALQEVSPEELKQLVGQKYGKVATCPLDKHGFPTGKPFALAVGYPEKDIDNLPDFLVESFAGVNCPPSFKEMKQGNVVLDIGCGAGLDLYFASQKVGKKGKVYGVDISEEMVKKAKKNLQQMKITNVEVKLTHSDKIPLEDESVDIVTSNGIYNLSPDKNAVFKEAYRVLRPNGVICFSEIVLKKELEEEIRKSVKDWFRCIGGALAKDKFISLMEEVGFKNIKVLSTYRNARCGHEYAVVADIKAYK